MRFSRAPAAPAAGAPGADDELLQQSWKGARVGNKILSFHVAFLQLIARPAGQSIADVAERYDQLLGQPSHAVTRRLQERVRQIVALESWPAWFRSLGLAPPFDAGSIVLAANPCAKLPLYEEVYEVGPSVLAHLS